MSVHFLNEVPVMGRIEFALLQFSLAVSTSSKVAKLINRAEEKLFLSHYTDRLLNTYFRMESSHSTFTSKGEPGQIVEEELFPLYVSVIPPGVSSVFYS